MGILINLFAQAIGEGGTTEPDGTFTLDLKKIRNDQGAANGR